jgi:glutathione S-transferase
VSWNWGNSSEYLALNPKGKVPTLVIDGTAYTETPAIVVHLARAHPEAALLPTGNDSVDNDVLATMTWFAADVHPLIARLRFPMSANDDPSSFERTRAVACDGLKRCFAVIESRLSDREWLYRDWTIMDAYLLWLWFRAVGSGMDGSAFPRCAGHARHCEERPSVASALDHEQTEYERLLAAGDAPLNLPPHQVGRAPCRRPLDFGCDRLDLRSLLSEARGREHRPARRHPPFRPARAFSRPGAPGNWIQGSI